MKEKFLNSTFPKENESSATLRKGAVAYKAEDLMPSELSRI
jgi:hypothetical protein